MLRLSASQDSERRNISTTYPSRKHKKRSLGMMHEMHDEVQGGPSVSQQASGYVLVSVAPRLRRPLNLDRNRNCASVFGARLACRSVRGRSPRSPTFRTSGRRNGAWRHGLRRAPRRRGTAAVSVFGTAAPNARTLFSCCPVLITFIILPARPSLPAPQPSTSAIIGRTDGTGRNGRLMLTPSAQTRSENASVRQSQPKSARSDI